MAFENEGVLKSQVEIPREEKVVVPKEYRVTFVMLVSCFILWGLLNNMTDNLVPAFGKIFMMSAVDSSLVQFAFYGSYAVLAIPAAIIIKKYTFRHGVLIGLGFYIVGALGYIPATILQNYNIFLVSIFMLAGGLSILETTCNPFVISLGDEETSIRRINYAQAFNPLGSLAGLFMAKFMILGNLNPADYEERLAMDPAQLDAIRSTELLWVCIPYVGLIAIALVIWIFFLRNKSSKKDEGGDLNFVHSLNSLLQNKRYVFGVITQFFYVGMQIAVWTWMTKYVMTLTDLDEATAVNKYLYAMVLFIVMRWLCTYLIEVYASKTYDCNSPYRNFSNIWNNLFTSVKFNSLLNDNFRLYVINVPNNLWNSIKGVRRRGKIRSRWVNYGNFRRSINNSIYGKSY